MLEGVEAGARTAPPVDGVLARVLRPRERAFAWAPGLFERLYGRGGFVLFTAPALALICALALAGLSAFGYLVAGRYGTPFVVAGKLGLGGLTFLLGRLAVVALHETAHGLALAAVGRRAGRAGIKLLLVFPYAFVDTSEAWFETRSRRIAVAVAGPLSDAAVGGAFALGCLAAPPGTLRDVLFQLAFVAYLGAFLNMNPLLDRDGYHILVDVLNEPGLRRRSRRRLGEALAGRPASGESATLLRYGVASVIWRLAAAGFAIVLSLRYYDRLVALAPREAVIAVFAGFWLMLLVPVMMIVGRPLVAGRRRMMSEVRRVRL
jgi:putative peptide zinc metalloprotease protein